MTLLSSIGASLPGFHPAQLDNGTTKILRGWFDPRDQQDRVLTGGRVSSYNNKATGAVAIESGTSGPTIGTGLNGGPCLVSTQGGGTALLSSEAGLVDLWAASGGLATHTIVALWQYLSVAASGHIVGCGHSAQPLEQSGGYGQRTSVPEPETYQSFRLSTGLNTSIYVSADNSAELGPTAGAYRYDGSLPSLRIGGADLPLTLALGEVNPAISPNRVALCNNGRSTLPAAFGGYLGPVLMYEGLLSDAEIDIATDGLRAWYGLPRLT